MTKPTRQLPGPLSRAWVARDQNVISPSCTRAYPFVMARGQGSEVWDVDGNRFLDFNAGIAVTATGHAHPEVVKAIQEQAEQFIHMSGTDFYYPAQIELAEKLSEISPMQEPAQVFFANSGTESVEAAFKLARYHTGRPRMLAFIGAFHGRSMGSLSLTASKYVQRAGFSPLVPGVTHVPYAYCYRCPFNLEYPKCDLHCVAYIEKTVFRHYVPPEDVAAIFVEPIQGEGGYVVPPPEYHARLKEMMAKYGILYVVDEVQTGFGRTGKWFAIEHWGVEPDIVATAKGIASGMPLGAMIARKSVMTWGPGAHANTFGGNPVCCAAAMATIRIIERDGLMENARLQGERMMEALWRMQSRHPSIGDVRGKGLMVGAELVADRESKEPATSLRDSVIYECYLRGLLILGCGVSTIRFMPALNISSDLVDEGLAIFDEALTAAEREAGLLA
ncbi:MAG: acetyl ornithine aminotransferase family protein [Anaerolineae bacterium]